MTFEPAGPFVRLGESVAAAWARASYDEAAFPALATRALEEAALHEGFSAAAMLGALVHGDPGYAQGDGSFGEPPIVLYRGRGFFIEVLYWLDATTDIHRHAFSGAFQVLHGGSIHATWSFRADTRVRSTLTFGEVGFLGVEQLRRGDVRTIWAGERFIHALFHLARPSVSVVVRTTREDDHLPQMNYLPPAIAWSPFEEDRLRDRRGQALRLLAESNRAALFGLMEEVVRDSDLPALFHALRMFMRLTLDAPALAHFAGLARARHGELADRLHASLSEQLRQLHIIARRAAVTDAHLRWLMALLLNVPTRGDIMRLIAAAGHGDATFVLLDGLRELARERGPEMTTLLDIEVAHDAGGSARVVTILLEVIRALMQGADAARAAQGASQAVGGLSSAEAAGMPGLVADLRRPTSPLAALFR